MPLSRRLERILYLVPQVQVLADIGTDHGQLPVAAIQAGKARRCIAVDKSGPSLEKAKKLVEGEKLKHLIDCRLGDGLSVLRYGEANAVVIAGMGGNQMIKILEPSQTIWGNAKLILQPNRDVEKLRLWMDTAGIGLTGEEVVQEGKRFYTILSAQIVGSWMVEASYSVPGWARDRLIEVGPYLLREGGDTIKAYYELRLTRLNADLKKAPEGSSSAETLNWRVSCYEDALNHIS